MNNYKLSVVVPCYNEEKNIPGLLDAFDKVIKRDDIEVVVVNNGSTDNSAEVIASLLPKYAFASVADVTENQGYGFGILSGLAAAKGEFIGWTHADLQTDPGDVLTAFSRIESHADPKNVYVKGDRKGRPFMDQFFTLGMSFFETLYLGQKLWDINAQPNIFHRDFYNSWSAEAPHDFSLDLYVLYQAKIQNLDLIRIPVLFPERIHGESHWNTSLSSKWKFIKRTLDFSTQLKKKL